MAEPRLPRDRRMPALPRLIFLSRWLQVPLYVGLIVAHVNASVLKVKLATAIIGISSIHLLKTFINAQAFTEKSPFYQTVSPHHIPSFGGRDRRRRPHHAAGQATRAEPRRKAWQRAA
jgi:uncharacterized membrane protein YqhA